MVITAMKLIINKLVTNTGNFHAVTAANAINRKSVANNQPCMKINDFASQLPTVR